MILFPLKDKKLRLELFLGLLLLIGAMPKGSQGLKCYRCQEGNLFGIEDASPNPFGGSHGDCSPPPAKPIEKTATGEPCELCVYGEAEGRNFKQAGCVLKIDKSHDGCKKKEMFKGSGIKGDVCYCKTDLCNKNQATVEKSVSGGSGKSTPDGRLVFAILIAPIFIGYLPRGGMAEAAA